MARLPRNQPPDLAQAVELTSGAIERLQCPPGKKQAFLRDSKAPGLRVRVTDNGAKSFVFEAKLHRDTIRRTIGDVRAWDIEKARKEANRLRVAVDSGIDPRVMDQIHRAEQGKRAAQALKEETTVEDAWKVYLAARKDAWGDRHYSDHLALAKAGGVPAKRGTNGTGKTIAGPLFPLMSRRLSDLTPAVVEVWAIEQGRARPTYGRLAWRCLKAFLAWCAEEDEYKALVPLNPAKTRKARDAFGKPSTKQDVLLREQLPAWFAAVRALPSATISAYLQCLLLIGSRRGELLALKWADLDLNWRGMSIRDKVEGARTIPLTPYVWHLIKALPKTNAYVFASHIESKKTHLADPSGSLETANAAAKTEGLTLHGLRRSFKSLTEWLEIPAGVVAQIMGHKPSATAEKHYTVRPLDLLRIHHERIEAWMLEQGHVQWEPKAEAALGTAG